MMLALALECLGEFRGCYEQIIIYEDGNVELPVYFDEKSNVQKMHIANSDETFG